MFFIIPLDVLSISVFLASNSIVENELNKTNITCRVELRRGPENCSSIDQPLFLLFKIFILKLAIRF